ncbi:response regulator [Heliobacterium gestii]|uniref:Stage 0 sporulation protein A homolog n=1 Tax=Heliomicrobium gestii TaxID=2699 RepID=A0A845LJC6_HELGE|nr:response regulator transcription factor [Heliomicrobium gestii]MBM7866228.1 DNA-binding response OmpR family regulator [Heliomicrobium gestii]MZP42976.1 response regulator [Heliomicrobium gestii]
MDRILVVEDDPHIQRLLSIALRQEGIDFTLAGSGAEALAIAERQLFSLVLLDIMLPDISGTEVCQQLRLSSPIPIVFMSCKNQDSDKILGLSIGADDYIEKPFNLHVLMARIRAHLRRNRLFQQRLKQAEHPQIRFDNIIIDLQGHRVIRNSLEIYLTAKEFEMLAFFCRHPQQVFTVGQLFETIWGEEFCETRTVIVHISNLRKKIEENPLSPKYILTVRGVGYKFAANTALS